MAGNDWRWMRLISTGPQILISTLVGWALGAYLLDPWLGTYPVFGLILALLGMAGAFIHLFRELIDLERQDNLSKSNDRDGNGQATGGPAPDEAEHDDSR